MNYFQQLSAFVLSATVVASLAGAIADAAPLTHRDGPLHLASHGTAREGSHQDHARKKMEQLGLSDRQQEEIRALKQQFYQENKATLDAMKADFSQLRTLKQSGNADPGQISALREKIRTQRESLSPKREALRSQIMALLTPEQQARLKTLHEECKERCRKRHQTKPM